MFFQTCFVDDSPLEFLFNCPCRYELYCRVSFALLFIFDSTGVSDLAFLEMCVEAIQAVEERTRPGSNILTCGFSFLCHFFGLQLILVRPYLSQKDDYFASLMGSSQCRRAKGGEKGENQEKKKGQDFGGEVEFGQKVTSQLKYVC